MVRRWVNPGRGRYYLAVVTEDLFGGWNLLRFWGGCDSRRGGEISQHIDDPEVLEKHLNRIAVRRRSRGYVESQGQGGSLLGAPGMHLPDPA